MDDTEREEEKIKQILNGIFDAIIKAKQNVNKPVKKICAFLWSIN